MRKKKSPEKNKIRIEKLRRGIIAPILKLLKIQQDSTKEREKKKKNRVRSQCHITGYRRKDCFHC